MNLVITPTRLRKPAGGKSNAPSPRALIDYDFQTALMAPPRLRLVLWLMLGLIVVVATALVVLKVDIVVAANGRVISSESEIAIQPLETAVVRSIAVKMGQDVKKGDILATLDPTFPTADMNEAASKLNSINAAFARLTAEAAGITYDPLDPNPEEAIQRDLFRKRRNEYREKVATALHKVEAYAVDLANRKAEVRGLQEQIQLADESNSIYSYLAGKGLGSKLKALDSAQGLVSAKSRLDQNAAEQQKLLPQIAGAKSEAEGFIQEWHRKLADELAHTRADRESTIAHLSKAQRRRELTIMTAPRDATVLHVIQRPAGSVIREAESLIRLVPNDAPLIFEAQIDTRDVARLRLGAPVTLKLEALPWQQFGLAYGELKALSPDTLGDENRPDEAEEASERGLKAQERQSAIHYRARIELLETKFRSLPPGFVLRPGMRAVADIKVGRRSIIEYLLNPITRVINESLREP
ncbi:HlyD family type I secretion periplasmic adaptor subunit [Bradyrhizobium elkanii]|uniref:HlyD family type I secretion periplasmic adaptor subunit n=1 Tax=Bradyrhizobium elkanii TaxID=29448 RepID=UPI001AE36D41|nr:HlyD family type I secretion periplasmic adaptor subunit [Bradyrhizobium elkanii]MBP2434251.1 HlyD family secretion protein [Bradyrhizobium elkanii]WLA88843.1 HlyD family type I secretion periplasmic adaptor subunit [Bradyrhizobium elkanii]